jgi:hypothetical protein
MTVASGIGTSGRERIIGARTASKMALSSSSATICLLTILHAWMEAPNNKITTTSIVRKMVGELEEEM